MEWTIETLSSTGLAYFRSIGEYGSAQNKAIMEEAKAWAEMNGFSDQFTILGIPQDDPAVTPSEKCRYDVGIIINDERQAVSPAMYGVLEGCQYAVFILDHTKKTVSNFWNQVFQTIEQHQLSVRNEPIIKRYTSDMIERYLCEIFAPIHSTQRQHKNQQLFSF